MYLPILNPKRDLFQWLIRLIRIYILNNLQWTSIMPFPIGSRVRCVFQDILARAIDRGGAKGARRGPCHRCIPCSPAFTVVIFNSFCFAAPVFRVLQYHSAHQQRPTFGAGGTGKLDRYSMA